MKPASRRHRNGTFVAGLVRLAVTVALLPAAGVAAAPAEARDASQRHAERRRHATAVGRVSRR